MSGNLLEPDHLLGDSSRDGADQPNVVTSGRERSLIYEPYYGLKEKPFSLSADPRFLYKGRSHAQPFEDLLTAIRRREGLIVLTGEVGTGKTTLCRAVLAQLDRKTFTTFVPDPFLSREDLLKMVLVDFGVVSVDDLKRGRLKGASRPDLSYPLYEFLKSLQPLDAFAVLIIDEAQNVPPPLLEEIRILSDLEDGEKLLQVVLIGQPELKEQLKLPQMRQVDQRISVRCELQPLTRDGLSAYVAHRLAIAGGVPDRVDFPASALDVVFRASGGVPRVINLICDRALQCGHLAQTAVIGPEIVAAAIGGLGLTERLAATPLEDRPPATRHRSLFERSAPTSEGSPTDLDLELRALLNLSPSAPRTKPEAARETASTENQASDSREPRVDEKATTRSDSRWGSKRQRGKVRLLTAVLLTVVTAGLGASVAYLQWLSPLLAEEPLPPIPAAPLRPTAAGMTLPPSSEELIVNPSAETDSTASAEGGRARTDATQTWFVEVAVFNNPGRAGALIQQLTAQRFPAFQVELDLGLRGRVQQVRVGPYLTVAEAESVAAEIRRVPGYEDARVRNNLGNPKSRIPTPKSQ